MCHLLHSARGLQTFYGGLRVTATPDSLAATGRLAFPPGLAVRQ